MASTTITQVYLGYTSSVYLFGKTTPIFCTSLSFSVTQQLITSQGTFYGDKNIGADTSKFRAFGPVRLDYPDIQATVSFQATATNMSDLITWITTRTSYKPLTVKTGSQTITFKHCYWTSISISTAQGQLVTVSISMLIRDNYNDTNRKIQSFSDTSNASNGTGSSFTALGSMYNTANIIPYYNTGVSLGDNRTKYVTGWTVDLSQPINKKAYCSAQATSTQYAPLPNHLMFGTLSATLKVTVLNAGDQLQLYDSVKDSITFNTGNSLTQSNLSLDVEYADGSTKKTLLQFGYTMLQSVAPVVSEQSSLQQIEYTYVCHKVNTKADDNTK